MRTLVLASHYISKNQPDAVGLGVHAPRMDYVEIARLLGADLSGTNSDRSFWSSGLSKLEHRIRLNLGQAVQVSRQLKRYDAVLSTSEKIAIPLTAVQKITGQATAHIVIAHRLSSSFKRALFTVWPLHQSFSHVICVSRAQADFAVETLGLPQSRVTFVYDKVDRRFFQPISDETDAYVLAVGKEQRDYETLVEAVAGTGIKLVVLASSPWSNRRLRPETRPPEHVTFMSRVPFARLKALYARARLVVVPLFDVSYAAGVNGLLEAMAMAKPVIVSRTAGIRDYVVDGETAVYVPVQNAIALRQEILRLWEAPLERKRLGANARQAVDDGMNLDAYVQAVAEIVQRYS